MAMGYLTFSSPPPQPPPPRGSDFCHLGMLPVPLNLRHPVLPLVHVHDIEPMVIALGFLE